MILQIRLTATYPPGRYLPFGRRYPHFLRHPIKIFTVTYTDVSCCINQSTALEFTATTLGLKWTKNDDYNFPAIVENDWESDCEWYPSAWQRGSLAFLLLFVFWFDCCVVNYLGTSFLIQYHDPLFILLLIISSYPSSNFLIIVSRRWYVLDTAAMEVPQKWLSPTVMECRDSPSVRTARLSSYICDFPSVPKEYF